MAAIIFRMCFTPLGLFCACSADRDRLPFGQPTLVQFEPMAEHQHTVLFMYRSAAGGREAAHAVCPQPTVRAAAVPVTVLGCPNLRASLA
jgi:hypothetical protein